MTQPFYLGDYRDPMAQLFLKQISVLLCIWKINKKQNLRRCLHPKVYHSVNKLLSPVNALNSGQPLKTDMVPFEERKETTYSEH